MNFGRSINKMGKAVIRQLYRKVYTTLIIDINRSYYFIFNMESWYYAVSSYKKYKIVLYFELI